MGLTDKLLSNDAPKILVVTWTRPNEIDFWQSLRSELNANNIELVIVGYFQLEKFIDIPYYVTPSSLDELEHVCSVLSDSWNTKNFTETDINEELLLQRERLWFGTECDEAHRRRRRNALHIYRNFYITILQIIKPSLTLIWNGQHPQEMLLDELCRRCNCPVAYIERGPFEGTIQLDPNGITGSSSIAQQTDWHWSNDEEAIRWRKAMTLLQSRYQKTKATWWEQPKSVGANQLRERLRIPQNAKIILFAGQVDEDTSNFLHSPNFKDNLDAFQWFCNSLRGKDDIFIIGKHHPMSKQPVDVYQDMLNDLGVWINDASLEDCLTLADRVAAVNSTVLFEALMLSRPVLSMGKSLLSGKGIAYEVEEPKKDVTTIYEWLLAKDFPERQERWLDFGAYLLAYELYTLKNQEIALGQRDSTLLAAELVNMIALDVKPDYSEISINQAFWAEIVSYTFVSSKSFSRLETDYALLKTEYNLLKNKFDLLQRENELIKTSKIWKMSRKLKVFFDNNSIVFSK